MRIIGKHRHLKPELFSEYLDGRLLGREPGRVDRAVAECAVCRGELESLQVTVSLLQTLPEFAPSRNFTLPAAPISSPVEAVEPVVVDRQPASLLARVPTWGYAGAVALAGLALALLVLVDVDGLLAPEFAAAPQPESAPLAQSAPAQKEWEEHLDAMESMTERSEPAMATAQAESAAPAQVAPLVEPVTTAMAEPSSVDRSVENSVEAMAEREVLAKREAVVEREKPVDLPKPTAAPFAVTESVEKSAGEPYIRKESPTVVPEAARPVAAPPSPGAPAIMPMVTPTPAPSELPLPSPILPTESPAPVAVGAREPADPAGKSSLQGPAGDLTTALAETPSKESLASDVREPGRLPSVGRIIWWILQGLAAVLVLTLLIALVLKLCRSRRISVQ